MFSSRFNAFLLASLLLSSPLTFSPLPAQAQSVDYARQLSEAFEKAAGSITPSIVNVSAVKKPKSGKGLSKRNDPFFDQFKEFFGDDFMERFGAPEGGEGSQGQQGLGTGVIVDPKGFILTNNHVVGDADEIEVRLNDGRKLKAEVVGRDERSDLAVIKVKASGLVAAKLGDSESLKIGEWVVAAGNPFGLENTITAGIVSAKGRSIMGGGQYEDFIQTDAAINPGNSGGPLVNLSGEVVGINTAIFSRSGGYMGIGFAIPISMAKSVMSSLIENGKVVRGWLGVGIQNLTDDLARSFKHSGTEGALIGHVDSKGPAAKGGLKQGDIVVAIDGDRVKEINQLRNRVASLKPGSTVKLDVVRAGTPMNISIKVGELPTSDQPEVVSEEVEGDESSLGVEVEEMSSQLARRLKSDRSDGVVVVKVRPGSLAAEGGLQPMDIILSVDGASTLNLEDFRTAIKSANLSDGIRLVVENQGMERFVFIKDE